MTQPVNIQYPPGFEDMLSKVSQLQGTMCDEECRNNRKAVKLYNEYENAVDDVTTGHERVKSTKRDFLIASRGFQEYQAIEQQQAERDASFVLNEFDQQFYQQQRAIKQQLQTVGIQQSSTSQLQGVDTLYNENMNSLTSVLEDTTNQKQIALRKAVMAESQYTTIQLWIGWITNVYWWVVLLYAVVIFGIGQGFRQRRIWITMLVALLFPRIVQWGMERFPSDWWVSFSFGSGNSGK